MEEEEETMAVLKLSPVIKPTIVDRISNDDISGEDEEEEIIIIMAILLDSSIAHNKVGTVTDCTNNVVA